MRILSLLLLVGTAPGAEEVESSPLTRTQLQIKKGICKVAGSGCG